MNLRKAYKICSEGLMFPSDVIYIQYDEKHFERDFVEAFNYILKRIKELEMEGGKK